MMPNSEAEMGESYLCKATAKGTGHSGRQELVSNSHQVATTDTGISAPGSKLARPSGEVTLPIFLSLDSKH